MKSTSIAFGLLGGLASAEYHHPRHFHTFYARNETTAAPSTTLTVQITQTHTITSCAPTVTNCPIKNGTEAVVTEVVDLTTTVCPVTEAEGVSSSVIGDHSSGKITGKTSTVTTTPAPGTTSDVSPTTDGVVNYPTQDAPSPTGENTGSVIVSETTGVVEETLSVTVGPESSKSVLVTTVQSTYTSQVTITMPRPGGDAPGAGTSVEGTTTLTSTSTGTRTVTIPGQTETASPERPETSNEGSNEGSDGSSNGGSCGGACECPPATTVTVTETMPASTVYVTAPVPTSTSTSVKAVAEEPYPTGTVPSEEDSKDVTPAPEDSEDAKDGEDADECPEQEEVVEGGEDGEEDVVEVTATVVPVPYPTAGPSGNGTVPTTSSAIVSSSVDISPTGSTSADVSPSSSASATEGVPTYPVAPVSSPTMSASSSAAVSSSTAVSPDSSAPASPSSSTQATTSTPEPVADYPTYPTYPAAPARK